MKLETLVHTPYGPAIVTTEHKHFYRLVAWTWVLGVLWYTFECEKCLKEHEIRARVFWDGVDYHKNAFPTRGRRGGQWSPP